MPSFFEQDDTTTRKYSVCRRCHHFMPMTPGTGPWGMGCGQLTARREKDPSPMPFELSGCRSPEEFNAMVRRYEESELPEPCPFYTQIYFLGDAGVEDGAGWSAVSRIREERAGDLPAEFYDFLKRRRIDPAEWLSRHGSDRVRTIRSGDGGVEAFLWTGLERPDKGDGFQPEDHALLGYGRGLLRFIWRGTDKDVFKAMMNFVYLDAIELSAGAIYTTHLSEDGDSELFGRYLPGDSLFQTGCGEDGSIAQQVFYNIIPERPSDAGSSG